MIITRLKTTNKKKKYFFRYMSTNLLSKALGVPNAYVTLLKMNKVFKNTPMVFLNKKERYAIVVPSQISAEHADVMPFSSTQGPGDHDKLSITFRDDGRKGEQNITEKFAVSEKTKDEIEVLCGYKKGLPGVKSTNDPDIVRRLQIRLHTGT